MRHAIVLMTLVLLMSGCADGQETRIGIITDLSGPAAYWGESTRVGAELAANDLAREGHDVTLIFEDYRLEANRAASAAQKLITIDEVDGLYVEFNPGAVAAGSVVEDETALTIYDAAVVSPLSRSPHIYKTYLDYTAGCASVAQKFKEEGVQHLGLLKVNLEFGELCLEGVRQVYPDVQVESYDLEDTDVRTQVLKLRDAEAIINVGFEKDTENTLKAIREQGLELRYGTVADTLTLEVRERYAPELRGSWSFGFKSIDAGFEERIGSTPVPDAAALAYTHIMQLGRALSTCRNEMICAHERLAAAPPEDTIGFRRYEERIAVLEMKVERTA